MMGVMGIYQGFHFMVLGLLVGGIGLETGFFYYSPPPHPPPQQWEKLVSSPGLVFVLFLCNFHVITFVQKFCYSSQSLLDMFCFIQCVSLCFMTWASKQVCPTTICFVYVCIGFNAVLVLGKFGCSSFNVLVYLLLCRYAQYIILM